ncbi:MAG: ankyrin repeat domain-containing protein [Spirochaetaceae bacterium]|nr:ankyrin repeat domain-containing protein [Myxococcales bacterium]MCB9725304.1 ankyrin repeat domain-containing protein [Spirochaetaceae bacterium]
MATPGVVVRLALVLVAFAIVSVPAVPIRAQPAPASVDPAAADAATRRLLVAASRGDAKAVRDSIAAGARIDEHRARYVGPGLQTALVGAALRGHAEVVRVLIEAGADPTIPEKDGYTVWHAAAFQGRAAVLRVLEALAVPGNGPAPKDGLWPLHRAASGGTPRHAEAVEVLIERGGAACSVRDPQGRVPLDLARTPRIRTLLDACAGPPAP